MEWQYTLDERELLPHLKLPTLVIHRRGERATPSRLGRELASMIPGARLILLEGRNHVPVNAQEVEEMVAPMEAFLAEGEEPERATGVAASATGAPLTILFTDIEGSTAATQRLGDAGAQELLHTHNASVREALAEHGGSEVKHTGDGIMASFPSASGAVECACAIQRALVDAEVRVRIGLNAGEPIAEDDDLFGTAVQLASRICDRAEPGQIFASDVVRQLVAGKGFEFDDAGAATLKGFEQPVALHEVRWQAG
jgi:class 3 adenylate cyclase